MKLEGVLLLAGFTARSQAYAQAMDTAGLEPDRVLIYGPEKPLLPGQVGVNEAHKTVKHLFTPNLAIPLLETCEENQWRVETLPRKHINDEEIVKSILRISPKLIVYSGYGSQLVGKELLESRIKFLHIHSGWLPEFRGSTTLYYSWLLENRCAASAILLRPTIDTGPIVAIKHYPPPAKGVDPDYVYDSAIRADLLVTVLRHYKDNGDIPATTEQSAKGSTYYVIHPVLKHLARLRI